MNHQYSSDSRNGYPQNAEQTPYIPGLSQFPLLVYPGTYQYYPQNVQNYQNQYYQQPQPTVAQIPHPQCSGTQFSVNIPPSAPSQTPSAQPHHNTVHSSGSQGKPLSIVDPETGQPIDLEKVNTRKVVASESNTVTSSATLPISIRDPTIDSETIDDDRCSHESEEQFVPPQQAACFNVASDEDESCHDANDESENNDASSIAADTESCSDESVCEIGSLNLNKEKGGPDSDAAIDEPVINPPKVLEKVESFSTGNIQKYNRDQLISIRSATDFSQMPAVPMSVVANVGGNSVKTNQRSSRRPQVRRVLIFNTNVVLDEVDNAYRPTHLSQNEKKEDIKMTLTFLLNHLTAQTVQSCLVDVKKLNIKKEEDIDTLVSTIVTKSGGGVFREAYAEFCKGLVEANLENFGEKLVKKLMEQVSTPIHVYLKECNDLIDAKIAQSNDDKVKKMFEEDRESTIAGKRENFFGVIEFFSYLFVHGLVPLQNFLDAIKSFRKPKSQDEVQALIKCVRIAGETLEKKQPGFWKNCSNVFHESVRTMKIDPHVRFAISEIKDLRERGWREAPQPYAVRKTSAASKIPHAMVSKVNDSKTPIDTKNLAVSSLSGRSSFLGPTKVWSEGSKAQRHKAGVIPDSDTDRASNSANRRGPDHSSNVQSDELQSPEDARRDFVDAFNNSDNPTINLLLKESLKPAFVKCVLCRALEGKASERSMYVNILTYLYAKEQLIFDHMVIGFNESIDFADELDLPKAGEYFGELLSSVVHPTSMNFAKLAEVFDKLPTIRDKSEALAQCAKCAAKRIGDEEVAAELNKTLSLGLPWGDDRSFKDLAFLKRYQLEFIANATAATPTVAAAAANATSSTNPWRDAGSSAPKLTGDSAVIERIDTCVKKMNFDELVTICSRNCKSKDSDSYLKRIFMACHGMQRKSLEPILPAVKTFIESTPESEKSLLFTLQSCVAANEFSQWLQAFIHQKIITHRSLKAYTQDKRSLQSHKEVARTVLNRLRP